MEQDMAILQNQVSTLQKKIAEIEEDEAPTTPDAAKSLFLPVSEPINGQEYVNLRVARKGNEWEGWDKHDEKLYFGMIIQVDHPHEDEVGEPIWWLIQWDYHEAFDDEIPKSHHEWEELRRDIRAAE